MLITLIILVERIEKLKRIIAAQQEDMNLPKTCFHTHIYKSVYTDIQYNDKIRYNDNLNGTIP